MVPVLIVGDGLAVGGQQADEFVLGAVGVLVFIHQDVAEALVPVGENLLILLKELHRYQNQVVKIQGVVFRQGLLVVAVDIGNYPAPVVGLLFLELVGAELLVLGVADGKAHRAGG